MDQQTAFALNYKNLVVATVRTKFQYLLLGIGMSLIVTLSFLFSYPKFSVNSKPLPGSSFKKTVALAKPNTYTVKKGDHLWLIASQVYGSGYKAYDIARANNIANPSLIEPGQVLALPEVQIDKDGQIGEGAKTSQVTLTTKTYTVLDGDFLWDIAQRAYGDGMMWTKIAQANSLVDPNILFTGTVLRLPR